jgi:ribosomal protein S18 acetylase RimI-like enzyme
MSWLQRTVRIAGNADRPWIDDVLAQYWGGSVLVVRGETIDLSMLPALVAEERAGFAIFRGEPNPELFVLHAFIRNAGVGTSLLSALVERLRVQGVVELSVTTTNDNVDALSFYQRRGFTLTELRRGAVDRARTLKPSIPETAENGIPIRDELELALDIRLTTTRK